MTNHLRIPALSLLAASCVLLAGCTFQLRDPDSQRDEPKQAPTSQQSSSSDDDDDADDDTSIGVSADRADAIGLTSVTLTCDDELEIDQPGASVRVEGPCDTLVVSGDATLVVADDVDTLRVTADGAVVYALEIDSIDVSGDVNTIYWTGSTPSSDDSGVANTLGKDS